MPARSLIAISALASVVVLCITAVSGVSADKVPVMNDRLYSVGIGCASAFSEVNSEGQKVWRIDLQSIENDVWLDEQMQDITGLNENGVLDTISVDIEKDSCKDKTECRGHIDVNVTAAIHQNSSSAGGYIFSSSTFYTGVVGNETINTPQGSKSNSSASGSGKITVSSIFGFIDSFNATPFVDHSDLNQISFTMSLNNESPRHGLNFFPKGGCPSLMVNGTQAILWRTSYNTSFKDNTPTTTSTIIPTATSTSSSTGGPNSATTTVASLFLSLFAPASLLLLA
eukprot:Nk52_evm18s1837 gene=Nk52_evmTU18s1837